MNRAVVNQEKVGNPIQTLDRLFLEKGDRLVRAIAAGHDERNAADGVQQKMMKRRVRQHHAQVWVERADPVESAAARLFSEQHDRSLRRCKQRLVSRRDLAVLPRRGDVANHDRKRLLIAVLPLPQREHDRLIQGIARQVEASQSLERTDQTAANRRDEGGERIGGLDSLAVCMQQLQLRPAGRTGIRLRVKTTIRWIFVLGSALGAHWETGHRRALPVIGRTRDDREPRPAVGAIQERIAVPAVARVEQLSQAKVASRHVGRDEDRTFARFTLFDPKVAVATRRCAVPRQTINLCERGKIRGEQREKTVERLGSRPRLRSAPRRFDS